MDTALLVVAVVSVALAAAAAAFAWRVIAEDRRRSEARVAALAADIHAAAPTVSEPARDRAEPPRAMFVAAGTAAGRRLIPLAAAGALALLIGAGIAMVGSMRSMRTGDEPAPAVRAALPLELVALAHERLGDRLTVRGVVRSTEGSPDAPLTAVVTVFDRDGRVITSGRAGIEPEDSNRNVESRFVVTVPEAREAARYRVSFRKAEQVVPHVDRRPVRSNVS